MNPSDSLRDLEMLVRSRYGVIRLETIEEDRAKSLLTHLADKMGLPLFVWTVSRGLRRRGQETSIFNTGELPQALAHITAAQLPAIYLFIGLSQELADRRLASLLQESSEHLASRSGAIVITGEALPLDDLLAPSVAVVRMAPPGRQEYWALLKEVVRDVNQRIPVQVSMTDAELNKLLDNLKGLTLLEAEKVLTRAVVEDGLLSAEDIQFVIDAKRKIVEKEGVLEYYPAQESLGDIADLKTLKEWLRKRKLFLINPDEAARFGLSFPRGILLLGVPGCGKSLCAKAVANEWGLPLLKLDPSGLYNKFVGETEANFRRAMAVAERLQPVVLWIDEIEKAFAAGDQDGGVSQRVLGTFLSWMQDRKGDIFIVATANDVSRLPPELLRKGRFDEIFFVDLPDLESREAIFRIHLERRKQDPAPFPLTELAHAAEGFSGAELEQVVVSALYAAYSAQQPLAPEALFAELKATRPVAETMAERIAWLRDWAKERTVSAH